MKIFVDRSAGYCWYLRPYGRFQEGIGVLSGRMCLLSSKSKGHGKSNVLLLTGFVDEISGLTVGMMATLDEWPPYAIIITTRLGHEFLFYIYDP